MLSIKDLSKTYKGGKTAVKNLSLEIETGDIYGFIGQNGAGKTTTIKCVTGILPFEEGEILIDGHSIKKEPVKCKESFAYIPDNPDIYGFMTGIAYINFIADVFCVPKDEREKRVERYAKEFGIYSSLADRADTYSHGMKQKLAIISAWIHAPKLILMDEPFGALDALTRQNMQTLIREIWNKTGNTIFLITHDVDEALALATRVIVMSSRPGRIVKEFHTDFTYDIVGTNQESAKYTQEYMHIREEILSIINTQNAALTADAI